MNSNFPKNDGRQCKVVCKHEKKYDYIMLYSRVVITTTFKVKTLFPEPKCGRVFLNKKCQKKFGVKVVGCNKKYTCRSNKKCKSNC